MSIRELLKPQHPPTRSAALLCATNNRAAAAALAILALLPACSPYPDDGEFFAGVVFARNFLAGVRRLTTAVQPPASNPAPPRAQSDERINAYSLLADTGTTSVTGATTITGNLTVTGRVAPNFDSGWFGVTSGTASIGRRSSARRPEAGGSWSARIASA